MKKERFLNTDARSNFANKDTGSVGFFSLNTDYDAFENLKTELLTFFNFLSDFNGITRADIHNSFFLLGVTDLL